MFSKTSLTLLILWMNISVLSGQNSFKEGYIITLDRDTLYGQIDFRGDIYNSLYCTFKQNLEKPVTYYPGTIYGYRIEDEKYYVSKTVETSNGSQNFFLEILMSGIIDLYYFRAFDGDHYYIETAKGEVLRLFESETIIDHPQVGKAVKRNKYYIGILKYAMSDAPELKEAIENSRLQQKVLVPLLHDYHNLVCKDENCITYVKALPVAKLRIAPFVSWQVENLNINGLSDFAGLDYRVAYYPSGGLSLITTLPYINDRLTFRVDISLGKRYFYGFGITGKPPKMYYQEAHLNNLCLAGDLKISYTYPAGRLRPSFYGGLSMQKSIAAEHRLDVDIVTPDIIWPTQITTNNWSSIWYGLNAGAGLETEIKSYGTLYCHLQYKNFLYLDDSSLITSLGIMAGFIF